MVESWEAFSDRRSVLVGRDGPLAFIRIDRPHKRNAIDRETAEELRRAITGLESDSDCVGIRISGTNGDLSSGADRDQPSRPSSGESPSVRMLRTIAECAVPTVAAIDGWAVGLGVGLAAATTYAVAGESSRFMLPEAKLGFFPFGVAPFLGRRVIPHGALLWALHSGVFSAADAHAHGLVTHLVPDGDAEAEAATLLSTLAASGPVVVRQAMSWYRTQTELADLAWCDRELAAALATRRHPAPDAPL